MPVEGLQEVLKAFDDMEDLGSDPMVQRSFLQEAKSLAGMIRQGAPVGKKGNIKRGIVSKLFRRKGKSIAFVGINFRIAPHAHLVEDGHGGPHPAPPHPFFRPKVNKFVRTWGENVKRALDKKVRKFNQ